MSEEDVNPYELLEVKVESTEKEIRTAYRQRSLKVHPDRNPNNPDAARKFHELNQAYELLLDPLRRLALDAKLRLKQARQEKYKAYDLKRKTMVDELEERERLFKKAKVDKQKEQAARFQETEKIKDEGRRMREERLKQMEEMEREAAQAKKDEEEMNAPPTLQSTDTTVRVKYALSEHPTLITPASLASLFAPFGETDTESIVVSLKPPKKAPHKPPKHGTALVPFKKIGDAYGAVCASGKTERGLADIEVGWIGGVEPEILVWLRKTKHLGPSSGSASSSAPVQEGERSQEKAPLPQTQTRTSGSTQFFSFPTSVPEFSFSTPAESPKAGSGALDFESLTLLRMRQAERERLEREILEQEANES